MAMPQYSPIHLSLNFPCCRHRGGANFYHYSCHATFWQPDVNYALLAFLFSLVMPRTATLPIYTAACIFSLVVIPQ
jgi:hypothetical protein